MNWADEVFVSRLQMIFGVDKPLIRPSVTFRGAWGASLRHIICLEKTQCEICPRIKHCLYPSIFDPGRAGLNKPRPFALDVRMIDKQNLSVKIIFIAQIRDSLLKESIYRLCESGLGRERGKTTLESFVYQGETTITDIKDKIPNPAPISKLLNYPEEPNGAYIRVGPFQERRAADSPTVNEFFMSCIRRIRTVQYNQNVKIDNRWELPKAEWHKIEYIPAQRYSQRKQVPIDLSGHSGEIRIGKEVTNISDLLSAAELLQIGRNTSSGLGVINVRWL